MPSSEQSATTAAARTITLPCVDKTEDPITPPTKAESDCPDTQADHPGERAGPNATNPATGADQAAPPVDTPALPSAKVLPAALSLTIPAYLPDGIEDLPPPGTIKTALR